MPSGDGTAIESLDRLMSGPFASPGVCLAITLRTSAEPFELELLDRRDEGQANPGEITDHQRA